MVIDGGRTVQATMVPETVMPIEMHHVHEMPEKALLPKLHCSCGICPILHFKVKVEVEGKSKSQVKAEAKAWSRPHPGRASGEAAAFAVYPPGYQASTGGLGAGAAAPASDPSRRPRQMPLETLITADYQL